MKDPTEARRGEVEYRINPDAPWTIDMRFGKGSPWVQHSIQQNARIAKMTVQSMNQSTLPKEGQTP